MLVFLDANLTFLAVPKTGTTAVELALVHRADIAFQRGRKHLTAQRYRNRVAPFLERAFGARPETVAVMRAPIDQIASWYRYRSREDCNAAEKSTRGCSFDDFVHAAISPDPPPFADFGSQYRFLTNGRGRIMVDHLFAWEARPRFLDFLAERLGERVEPEERNVSPRIEAALSPEVETELRHARAEEFALHEELMAKGGYLRFGAART